MKLWSKIFLFQRVRNNSLIGSLDLGGGSVEVTFVPDNPRELPDEYMSRTSLYGVNYTLYTHSYQCYGFKEAQRRLMAHLVEVGTHLVIYFEIIKLKLLLFRGTKKKYRKRSKCKFSNFSPY